MNRYRQASFQWRWAVFGGGVLMALLLWIWQSPDLSGFRQWADETAHHPLTILAVILIMAVTLTFGLPGSVGLWLIAPFHPPWAATLMLVTGSVGGALGGYWLAASYRRHHPPRGMTWRVMNVMGRRGDALSQCVLRILPGFPHFVINYAAGLLRLPLGSYLAAAVIGLGIKWSIYASVIYGAIEAVEMGDVLSMEIILPLLALILLLLLGAWVRRVIERKRKE